MIVQKEEAHQRVRAHRRVRGHWEGGIPLPGQTKVAPYDSANGRAGLTVSLAQNYLQGEEKAWDRGDSASLYHLLYLLWRQWFLPKLQVAYPHPLFDRHPPPPREKEGVQSASGSRVYFLHWEIVDH